MAYIREAVVEDIWDMAPRMRETDRQEVMTLGLNPTSALALSLYTSTSAYTGVGDCGKPLMMFGVSPSELDTSFGLVWLLAAEGVERYGGRILLEAGEWVERLSVGYQAIGNIVDSRNLLHLRWVHYCGFFIDRNDPVILGEGIPYFKFIKIVECVQEQKSH